MRILFFSLFITIFSINATFCQSTNDFTNFDNKELQEYVNSYLIFLQKAETAIRDRNMPEVQRLESQKEALELKAENLENTNFSAGDKKRLEDFKASIRKRIADLSKG